MKRNGIHLKLCSVRWRDLSWHSRPAGDLPTAERDWARLLEQDGRALANGGDLDCTLRAVSQDLNGWGGLQKTLFWTQGKVPEVQKRVFQGVDTWGTPQKRVFQRVGTWATPQKRVFQGVGTLATPQKRVFQGVGTLGTLQKRVFQRIGTWAAPQKRVFQRVSTWVTPQKRVFQGRGTFPYLQKTIGSRMGTWISLRWSWFFEFLTPRTIRR